MKKLMLMLVLVPLMVMAQPEEEFVKHGNNRHKVIEVVPEGAVKYGNNWYKVIELGQAGTWGEGHTQACKLKGHMVSIESKAENDFVKGLLSGETWVGVFFEERRSADKVTRLWKTFSFGRPVEVTYFNWHETPGSGIFVSMDGTGAWKRVGASKRLQYIVCEWEGDK